MLHVVEQLYEVLASCREDVSRVEACQAADYADGIVPSRCLPHHSGPQREPAACKTQPPRELQAPMLRIEEIPEVSVPVIIFESPTAGKVLLCGSTNQYGQGVLNPHASA